MEGGAPPGRLWAASAPAKPSWNLRAESWQQYGEGTGWNLGNQRSVQGVSEQEADVEENMSWAGPPEPTALWQSRAKSSPDPSRQPTSPPAPSLHLPVLLLFLFKSIQVVIAPYETSPRDTSAARFLCSVRFRIPQACHAT